MMIVRRLNLGTYGDNLPFCVYLFPGPQGSPVAITSSASTPKKSTTFNSIQIAYRLRDIDVLFCDKSPGYLYSSGKIPPVFIETPGHFFQEQNGHMYFSSRALNETATRLGNHFLADFCRLERTDFFSGAADRILSSVLKLTRVPIHESEYEFEKATSPAYRLSTSPRRNGNTHNNDTQRSPQNQNQNQQSGNDQATPPATNGVKRGRVDEVLNKTPLSGSSSPRVTQGQVQMEGTSNSDDGIPVIKSEPDDGPEGLLYTPSKLSAILDETSSRGRKRPRMAINNLPAMPILSPLFSSSKSKDPAMMDQVRKSLELKQQQKALIEARNAQQQALNQQQGGKKANGQTNILPRPGTAGTNNSNSTNGSPQNAVSAAASNPHTSNLLTRRPMLSPGHKNARGLTIKTGAQVDNSTSIKSAPIQAGHGHGYSHSQSGYSQLGYAHLSGSSEGTGSSNPSTSSHSYNNIPRTAVYPSTSSPHHHPGPPHHHNQHPATHHSNQIPPSHLPHHVYGNGSYGNVPPHTAHTSNPSQTVNGLISPRASDFATAQAQAHANAVAYNQARVSHLPPPPNTAAIVDRQHAAQAGGPHHGIDQNGPLPSPSYFASQQAALQNMPSSGPLTASQTIQHHTSKASYLQVFETFYDALSDSRVLKATLEEQIRKSASLLQTLQASASMIENMVRREFREMQKEMIKDLMVLERRIERLEDKVWLSPNNLPELRPIGTPSTNMRGDANAITVNQSQPHLQDRTGKSK